jgi:DNA helicase-2/ATP-dependent DNA helicase PcrA
VDLGEDERIPQVDLFAERHDVRQAARRSTFTGKTYNSLENISQFFSDRGIAVPPQASAPAPAARPAAPVAPTTPVAHVVPKPAVAPQPLPQAPRTTTRLRAGMTIHHPVYGEGIVVRREGDGEDAKITVSFPRHGLKKLVEKYAKLKRS